MIGKRIWDHPGKKEIALNIKGISPTLSIVVPPDVDGPALAATLTERLKECVKSTIRETVNELLEYQDNGLDFLCTREEVLLSAVEYEKRRKAFFDELPGTPLFASSTYDAEIDNNPDNGKHGMWLVTGIRHNCIVNRVSTARDAIDKAIASGEVGSWECCVACYLDPDGPEVIPAF